MTLRRWLASALVATGTFASPIFAAEPIKPASPVYSFSTLKAVPAEDAKAKLLTWLKSHNKLDAAKFDAIWADNSRSVTERTLETVKLGLPEAAALLEAASKADVLPPAEVPALLLDKKLDPFVRANLAASYATQLASKRVYEEALEAMKGITPELLVDPAAYFFYKSVAEYSLIQRESAINSIVRLLDDVTDTPDRYKVVAALMFVEIQNWSKDEKDLANIGRLMDNSGRRLDLARAGQKTQEIQKKIIFRLDEKIKELEQQQKKQGQGDPNGGGCPCEKPGNQPGNGQGPNPMQDSNIATNGGPGQVDQKKLRQYEENWGKLPEAERKKIMTDVAKDVPDKWKPIIEDYFRTLNKIYGYK